MDFLFSFEGFYLSACQGGGALAIRDTREGCFLREQHVRRMEKTGLLWVLLCSRQNVKSKFSLMNFGCQERQAVPNAAGKEPIRRNFCDAASVSDMMNESWEVELVGKSGYCGYRKEKSLLGKGSQMLEVWCIPPPVMSPDCDMLT